MEYTQIDAQTRLNAIRVRIRDLERQYLDLDLRATAPDISHVTSEMDNANMQKLEEGLARLREMEQQLQSGNTNQRS